MLEVGEEVVVLTPSGRAATGTITARHADGSVTVTTARAEYRAEAVVVFKVINEQRLGN